MDRTQINKIAENCRFPGKWGHTKIAETHISWIIMAEDFAYKIKKPVKLSFLDFSTLEKRKHFCCEELKLNRRLEPEMYLNVLPVTSDLEIVENETGVEVIDYALKMKRMDNSKEMDAMLRENKVTEQHIEKLAEKIVCFHKKAKVVKNAFRTLDFHEEYADIQNQGELVKERLGNTTFEKIKASVNKSFEYLNSIRSFSNERVISGFQRDCHGDLNAHNIFLYDSNPVIFDCIEFSNELRQIDVLNEIAFLCVDLDFYGKTDLSALFYQKYLEYSGATETAQTKELFEYYKSYRANIRAKVTLISVEENKGQSTENKIDDIKKYIDLMAEYLDF